MAALDRIRPLRGSRVWLRPMVGRSPTEEHRASTPLELLVDLCFVVAVAQAGAGLHHALADQHYWQALTAYPMAFFAIWWAWLNFTWFASAYDTDDVAYRLATFLQAAGVLVLAAGVPRAVDHRDFAVGTVGYVIMRVALVGQWLRAGRSEPACRGTAARYAAGVAACQAGWIGLLAVPEEAQLAGWLLLVPAELFVPWWAERSGATPWHPDHITERYGLFTLIVLGESLLAATTAFQAALDGGHDVAGLAVLAAGGMIAVFTMWWVYFNPRAERLLHRVRRDYDAGISNWLAFQWGYGHLVVFASAAAVGSGLQLAVDHAVGEDGVSSRAAGLAVAIPLALFFLSVWLLVVRHLGVAARPAAFPGGAVALIVSGALGAPTIVVGLLAAAVVLVAGLSDSGDHRD